MKKMLFLLIIPFLSFGQCIDKSLLIKSSVNGIFEGFNGKSIIQLANGQVWIQTKYYYEYDYSYMPTVLIYKYGTYHEMQVEGIAESVGVRQIPENIITRSYVNGDFEGFDRETTIELINGQIWEQSEYYYKYCYAYMPSVLIYKDAYFYYMLIEGVDQPVMVSRLK